MRRPWLRELVIAAALYLLLYRVLVAMTPSYSAGAFPSGVALWSVERSLCLPSEVWVQSLVHWHYALVVLSVFYLVAHPFSPWVALAAAWRHDPQLYYRVRRAFVVGTVVSLGFSLLVPVAPPRLLGVMADVPAQLHLSEYSLRGVALYAAFPSVHLVWAVIVGRVLGEISGSGLVAAGWVGLTVAAVVITGNHTWADCAAGGLIGYGALRVPALKVPKGITTGRLRKSLCGDSAGSDLAVGMGWWS